MLMRPALARVSLTCVLASLPAVPAAAQTAETKLPRGDASVSLGWLNSDVSALSRSGDDWASGRITLAAQAGFYWTEHLKTEVVAERSTHEEIYEGENVFLSGGRTAWRNTRHDVADTRLSVGQFYQFGRNAWAHVALGGGLSVTWRDIDSETSPVILLTKTDVAQDIESALAEVEAVALGAPVHAISALTDDGME